MRIPCPHWNGTWVSLLASLLLLNSSGRSAEPPPAPSVAAYATEEEWIVDSVARDILSYAGYAALGADAGKKTWSAPVLKTKTDGAGFQITWKLNATAAEQTVKLEVPVCVWLPETYTAWAEKLLPARPLAKSPAKPGPPSGLLEALLTPTATIQEQQNQKVSQWLAREPANPAAHEEAALLLTSLGRRESAGVWLDRRRTISRVTAQLAFASALRGAGGKRTEAGNLAETWLNLTLQRSADTLKLIAAQRPNPSRPVQAWLNALEMLQTGDWRQYKDPAHASLLEQEVFTEVLGMNTTVARSITFFASQPKLVEVPDPFRSCLNRDFRIAAGHLLTSRAVDMELAEIRTLSSGSRDPAGMTAWLNTLPGLPVAADSVGHSAVHVIDPGMWAGYSQRHLLYTISRLSHFYWMLGIGGQEAREDLGKATAPLVSQLRLGAYLRRPEWGDEMQYQTAMEQLSALGREHPEWITPSLWAAAAHPSREAFKAIAPMPDPAKWFNPVIPRGCAQSSGSRAALLGAPTLAYFESAFALNPRENYLALGVVKARKEDVATAIKTYGPLNDYSLPVMQAVAEQLRDNPPAYRKQVEKLCEIDPAAYMQLGRYLAEHLMSEEAAAVYQKGVAVAPDPVDMANSCQWLINWYFAKGRRKEAIELAQRATATGSSKGIWTEAYLDEQMGNLPKAFATLKRIQDVYGLDTYLICFCGRHRNDPAHPEYGTIYLAALEKKFPKSMTKVNLEFFTEVPKTAGVLGETIPPSLIEAGIHPKAVIVGVNGQLCTSNKSYAFLRDSSPAPAMELIIRQDRKFQKKTVKTLPPLIADFDL